MKPPYPEEEPLTPVDVRRLERFSRKLTAFCSDLDFHLRPREVRSMRRLVAEVDRILATAQDRLKNPRPKNDP